MRIKSEAKNYVGYLLKNKENIYVGVLILGCLFSVALMYLRCFYGTEISDEAYYVAEAKAMLNGNTPYAVNAASRVQGFTFLLIPIIYVYKLFSPELAGVFLATRLCYTTYRFLIIYVFYRILKKRLPKHHALLLSGILIPLGTLIGNFSYNTVPLYSMLLVAILVFDVVDQEGKPENIKLIIAGIFGGIACFANPGYGVALIVLATLVIAKSTKHKRINRLLLLSVGIVSEIVIVVLPIIIQTSISKFLYGVYRLYINPIPVDSLAPDKNFTGVISGFREPTRTTIIILVWVLVLRLVYIFSKRYICKNGKKLDKHQSILLSVTIAFCINLLYWVLANSGTDTIAVWGYTVAIYYCVFMAIGIYKGNGFLYYIGFYPIIYAVLEIVLIDGGAGIGRFSWSITAILGLFYALLRQKSKFIRMGVSLTIIMMIGAMGYANFKHVYRDDSIENLKYKVETGVYAGIYTTEGRSRDLPELEAYLNETIGKNDIYAFRDNVPFAYLMMHHGKMCEISTWDILQYTYERNSPSILFDYYRNREMIPEKIIYIDYGRDSNLSIEDSEFYYNQFVNTYYNQVDDFVLNDTFYHIVTYEYNGNFDGNYNYWYEKYYKEN